MATPTPIQICRPGRFTSVQGTTVEFSDADIAGMLAAYDPENEPAPLVIGHPRLDAPGYGWVDKLSVEDGILVAHPGSVEPSFAEAVAEKRYRRVSPEFYPPAHPSNPRPGSWYLKHVGFLGAAAPAIRGLKPVSFSEAQAEGAITIDINPEEFEMPEDQVQGFAERETALAAREAELNERQVAADERDRQATEAARTALHATNVSFAEGLAAAGKLAPAGKDLIVGLLDDLASLETHSFGEANGELAPIEAFKKLFEGVQPIVSFAELAPGTDEKVSVVSFAAPTGYTVDATALETHGKALAHQAAHSGVSYIDAVKAVS